LRPGPLHLDYVRRPPLGSWAGWALLAAGAAAAAVSVHAAIGIERQAAELETRLARLERKRVPVVTGQLAPQDAKKLAEQLRYADTVAERLTLPWERLLQAFETVETGDVALLTLEPDAQRKTFRASAEAKNKKGMVAYVGRLGGERVLQDVHLVEHQSQLQDPGQPVRFSIRASWGAASHEDR
jgi:hypothetical protein